MPRSGVTTILEEVFATEQTIKGENFTSSVPEADEINNLNTIRDP